MRNWTTSIFFAAATTLAAIFSSSSPDEEGGTSLQRVGEDEPPTPRISSAHVCYVFESKFTKSGRRMTVVMLDDGRRLESEYPLDAWRVSWPRFLLATANGGHRWAIVNPEKVVDIQRSMFRRSDRETNYTVICVVGGGNIVVQETEDSVRRSFS